MNAIITWRLMRVVMTFSTAALIISSAGADDAMETHQNTHGIKSIQLEDGDVVDCVDIYKQPAFDHTLLKDHKIIMSPSFPEKTGNIQETILQPAWQESEGCPEGTIPIRRAQKSDLLGASPSNGFGRKDVSSGQVERAGKTLYNDGPYIGTQACLNTWAVWVDPDEWSQLAVEVSDGQDRDNNKIVLEAGWVVNPRVFGDNRTRAYVYWTMDGYNSTGCYNLMCPGFVQMKNTYVLGGVIDHISTFEGEQFCFNTTIYMDTSNSVWWLIMGGVAVGYWPLCLFKKHGGGFEGASTVKWIGSVLNTNRGGHHTATAMGSGHYAEEGWRKAANVGKIHVMKDAEDGFHKPPATLAINFADNALCYDFDEDDDMLFLGGPGRGSSCP